MREGWAKLRLGDFVSLQRGHDLPEERRRTGSVPVMGSFGVTGWHDEALAKGPGVVIGRSGASFGRVSYSERDYWPLNTCLYVTDFRGNHERFAFYLLSHIDFSAFNSGSAQPSLNRNYIYPLLIDVPPVCEQRRIAEILGALDDKIALNRRMNETLDGISRVSATQFRSKSESLCPKRRLGEFARLERGLSYKGAFLAETGPPMINLACFLGSGRFDTSALKHYSGPFSERHIVKIGDLVIANTDITQNREVLGSPALVPPIANPILFSHHIYALRGEAAPNLNLYIYYQLLSDDFRERATGFATGTTVLALPADAVLSFEIPWPSTRMLRDFANEVRPLHELQFRNEMECVTLAQLRDTLLPKLLSGELRVATAEKELAGHV